MCFSISSRKLIMLWNNRFIHMCLLCEMFVLQRFRHSGAIVTTSEAVLLQLIESKDHPQFKAIQGLIKESAPNTGLVAGL